MSGIPEYIKQYGGVSFRDLPFGEADNVTFCEVFYMALEKVVSADLDAEPEDFADVCENIFEYHGRKHEAVGLVLPKHISVMLQEMAKYKRFREMKVVGCTETFAKEPAVQFGAGTFLLPDGTIVVMFRGTDDTLTGWKEDLDLFVRKSMPSHQLAVDYLEEVADKFDGKIIICGHSKGGNIAIYSAIKSSKKVRDRILRIYNNDGPGFADSSIFETEEYKEILPRYSHFIPSSSFIGVLLEHDDDYTVVKSKRIFGPMQHDLATWEFEGNELVKVSDLNALGKINDLSLKKIIFSANEEQSQSLDEVLGKIIEGTGQNNLLGFAKNVVSSVKGARTTWKNLDKETKELFTSTFKDSPKYIVDAISTVRSEDEAQKKAEKQEEAEKAKSGEDSQPAKA